MRRAQSGSLSAVALLMVGCIVSKMHVESDDMATGGMGGYAGSANQNPAQSYGGGNLAAGGDSSSAGASSVGGNAGMAGAPAQSASCLELDTSCQSESCCASLLVTGGSFELGRSESGTDAFDDPNASSELPEHHALVDTFVLDKYEVTVGRFRKFVAAYPAWHVEGHVPASGAGTSSSTPDTGWDETWNRLPADAASLTTNLKTCSSHYTWTDEIGGNEAYPVNCVTWYEAFAFCIWDGGRLPTEAEWEYAAAGGALNRLYPWGPERPDVTRANFAGNDINGHSPLVAVGSFPAGANALGHLDMAGSLSEWVFDRFSPAYYRVTEAACTNCANTAAGESRSCRGGHWQDFANSLRAAARQSLSPDERTEYMGFRCARSPG